MVESNGDNGDNGVVLSEHEAELYDRQIRLWGLESQKRIRASKILICGVSGIGAEVAKNIILAGVKSVVLLDDKNVSAEDSCSQFLAPIATAEAKNRAEASLERARALNPMVEVTADTESLEKKDADFFTQFDVLVVTGASDTELLRIDLICREKNVKFFSGDVWGMFGYSFADLQEHEFVVDYVRHKVISQSKKKVKTELVTSGVKGIANFPSFQEVLDFDFNSEAYLKKIKRSGPAFVVLRVLQTFRETFKRDPHFASREEDIKELIKIRNEISSEDVVPDSSFTHVFAQISPTAAIVGGELAQEVIKTVSKKEAPHLNVFLFDPDTCSGFIESICKNSQYI